MMKPYFERLRPCNDPLISEFINIVSGCGRKFSFASSHASTTFSLETIKYLLSDKKIFKIASLNTEIKVLKSEFIEVKKQLLILKKESTVTKVLAENGVGPASSPPIKIIISNE